MFSLRFRNPLTLKYIALPEYKAQSFLKKIGTRNQSLTMRQRRVFIRLTLHVGPAQIERTVLKPNIVIPEKTTYQRRRVKPIRSTYVSSA